MTCNSKFNPVQTVPSARVPGSRSRRFPGFASLAFCSFCSFVNCRASCRVGGEREHATFRFDRLGNLALCNFCFFVLKAQLANLELESRRFECCVESNFLFVTLLLKSNFLIYSSLINHNELASSYYDFMISHRCCHCSTSRKWKQSWYSRISFNFDSSLVSRRRNFLPQGSSVQTP